MLYPRTGNINLILVELQKPNLTKEYAMMKSLCMRFWHFLESKREGRTISNELIENTVGGEVCNSRRNNRIQKILNLSVLLFFASILPVSLSAQSSQRISLSANSSASAIFAEVPVDKFTGVADISVPLFAVTGKKLVAPISLRYHASGIKVDQTASWVGLGFQLQSGGSITRIVRGRPDEEVDVGYFSNAATIPAPNATVSVADKNVLASNEEDMMPDIFYYNVGGDAGRLIFDNALNIHSIPKKDLKITVSNTSDLGSFTVISDDGTVYEFNDPESTRIFEHATEPVVYKSTWYLSRIISNDRADTIRFNYASAGSISHTTNKNSYVRYYYNAPAGASKVNNSDELITETTVATVFNALVLQSIESAYAKIVLQTGARTDKTGELKLERLIHYVKDPITSSWTEQKRTNFLYTYFNNSGSGQRLRLDAIQDQAPSGALYPQTKFFYNTEVLDAPGSPKQDHWGYYNGRNNSNLVPEGTYNGTPISESSGNGREPDSVSVDGFMLTKIVNPMGGSTEYKFASNQYFTGTATKLGPGLRIRKVIRKDPYSAIESITNYQYGNGILFNNPSYHSTKEVRDGAYTYNAMEIHASPTDLGSFAGPPLVYSSVTEFYNGNKNTAGKTVSIFNTDGSETDAGAIPYVSQEESAWAAGRLLSETAYKVVNDVSTPVTQVVNKYAMSPTYATIKGMEISFKKILLNSPTLDDDDFNRWHLETYSIFQHLRESTTYTYDQTGSVSASQTQNFFYDRSNLHLQLTKMTTGTSESSTVVEKEFTYPADYSTGALAVMKNLHIYNVPVEVISKEIVGATTYVVGYQKTDFQEWAPSRVYPLYAYRPKLTPYLQASTFNASPSSYLQRTSQFTQYNASGILQEASPEGGQPNASIIDDALGGVTAQVANAQLNQVAYTSFESNDHGQWSVNQGSQIQTQNLSLYQNGVGVPFVIQTGQTISFTYSITRTAGAVPVLTLTAPGQVQIDKNMSAASGGGTFALAPGSWTAVLTFDTNVSSISVNFSYDYVNTFPLVRTSDARTGSRSLTLADNLTITKTNLPAGDYYVSYYQKSGALAAAVGGTASIINTESFAAESDGWQLIRKTIHIGSPSDVITLSGNGVQLDELRLHPKGALMSTTCYDVFRRIHTATDANVRSQFTDYDEWGRTIAQRDHFRNIVRSFEYKIAVN